MSLLEGICEYLGVEVGEEWKGTDNGLYKFDTHGNLLKYYKSHENWYKEQYLTSKIISGKLKPIKKPKKGEYYWTVDFTTLGGINQILYNGTIEQQTLYHRGLLFSDREEAKKIANKLMDTLKEE